MSIKVSTQVWKNSSQNGTALLVLVALADYANNEGLAWPSISTLAKRCRLSERQLQRQLRKLEMDGEIIRLKRKVHGYWSNLYQIAAALLLQDDKFGGSSLWPNDVIVAQDTSSMSVVPDIDDPNHLKSMSPNPSGNNQGTVNERESIAPPAFSSDRRKKKGEEKRIPDEDTNHAAINAYQKVAKRRLNVVQCRMIVEAVVNLDLWQETIQHWLGHGWSISNIQGMLDLYCSGGPVYCSQCKRHRQDIKKEPTVSDQPVPSITEIKRLMRIS